MNDADAIAAPLPEENLDIVDSDAEYAMEYPAVCPVCGSTITTVKVVRLLRSRVNFTSMLPRHGRAVICPSCRTILSAALSIA